MDLTDIKGSCTDLRGKFESGQAFQREGEDRRRSIVEDIAEEGALDTAPRGFSGSSILQMEDGEVVPEVAAARASIRL